MKVQNKLSMEKSEENADREVQRGENEIKDILV